jgi:hypothetical protein
VAHDARVLLEPILALHDRIRAGLVESSIRQAADDLAAVSGEESCDTIYAIDRVGESMLIDGLAEIARDQPLWLIAEGLPSEGVRLPHGVRNTDCRWRVIVDPIDGTRGLMYQKRSGWILTGVAPYRGHESSLRDIELAVQTEIPLVKQHLSDQLWAIRAQGVRVHRHDRVSGEVREITLRPSRADTIAHGFASVCRFFPGVRDAIAEVDDEVIREVLGDPAQGKAACFEDQYLSTGGQLYELMAGHDRYVADLRPLFKAVYAERGLAPGLCCHPYDMCTALIASELGVVITGAGGEPFDAPFDLNADVAWIGYANDRIRRLVAPALQRALGRRGLLPGA